MGTMMLVYMAAPIILFLINIIYGHKHNDWLIVNGALLAIFAALTFLRVYFCLPSRNLLSILISNGFWGAIYEAIAINFWSTSSRNGNKKGFVVFMSGIGIFAAMFLVGLFGEIHY